MSIQPQPMQNLLEKIQSLPAERIAEVEDFVDFLKQRTQTRQASPRKPLDFPVISVGKWPEDLSLRREDMYGDDGR
ncbi:MAG: DUF2281 domain-containing protein [Gammaproteobacteria bacterium]|nr:DUF2281 domain-containing protein [Gammaproteobacteria bacterium]